MTSGDQLEQSLEEVRTLAAMGRYVGASLDISNVLKTIARYSTALAESDGAVIVDIHDEAVSVEELSNNYCFSVQTFPNPFTEQVNLEITANCNDRAGYRVTDVLGKVIFEKHDIESNLLKTTLSFKENEYPSGVYFLNVYSGDQVKDYKLMKINVK